VSEFAGLADTEASPAPVLQPVEPPRPIEPRATVKAAQADIT
jgi:hypothetical protein